MKTVALLRNGAGSFSEKQPQFILASFGIKPCNKLLYLSTIPPYYLPDYSERSMFISAKAWMRIADWFAFASIGQCGIGELATTDGSFADVTNSVCSTKCCDAVLVPVHAKNNVFACCTASHKSALLTDVEQMTTANPGTQGSEPVDASFSLSYSDPLMPGEVKGTRDDAPLVPIKLFRAKAPKAAQTHPQWQGRSF